MSKIVGFFNKYTNQKMFRLSMLLFFVSVFVINNQWFGQSYLEKLTGGIGMIDMNTFNSTAGMYGQLGAMGAEGRLAYLTLLKLDYFLILTLGLFQTISILRLTKSTSEKLQILIIFPLARGVIDAIENVLLHWAATMYPFKNVLLLRITSALIFLKWIVFWITIAILLGLVVLNIYYKIKRRKETMKENVNIVILTSSARKNGYGRELAESAKRGAEETGANVEIVDLYSAELNFCTGCLHCMESGKCVISDGFQKIKDKLKEADGIIMCAPTFCGSYNGIMKNFVDRLGLYERFTSSLGEKYVVGISTAGDSRAAKKTAGELAKLLTTGIFARGYISGSMGASSRMQADGTYVDQQKVLNSAHKLGVKLATDIKERKKYPLQNVASRILSKLVMRPAYKKVIEKSKDASTKGVYENLVARNLI